MKTTNLGQDTKFDTLPPEMVLKIFIMLPSYGAMNTPTYSQAVYKGNNPINDPYKNEKHNYNYRQNFTALVNAIKVSKYWKKIGEDPKLWKKFCLIFNTSTPSYEVKETLKLHKFQKIQHIHFTDNCKNTYSIWMTNCWVTTNHESN